MKQAVIYARVSTKEQEKEGYSIPAQLALLQDYAQRNNITVMQTYTEAETAKKAGRVAFTQMKDYLKATPEVTCILVEKTDRLYRNFKDYVLLEDLDVEVHLVKEGEVMSKESASSVKFIHGIKVLMAKNYIDNLSEEVKKGMYEKARQGHFPFQPPYGYRNNRQTRMIDVCPERSVFVERAFALYATGQYSLQEVSHQLVAEGFRYRPYQAKIAKSSLEVMLKNIFYTGDFMIKDQFFNGKHQALVSPALFEKVKSILTRGTFSKPVKHDFAFAGMMTCGHCGCAITGQIQKKKYIYYHCSGWKGKCEEPYHREEKIAEQFAMAVKRVSLKADDIDWLIKALKESHQDEISFHETRVDDLHKQQKLLHKRLDQIYDDKLDGIIEEGLWLRKQKEYKQELAFVEKSLAQHSKANLYYIDSGVQLLELAKNAYRLYEKQSPHQQRKLLNFLLLNSSLKDGNLDYTYRKPFDWIVNSTKNEKWWRLADSNRWPSQCH